MEYVLLLSGIGVKQIHTLQSGKLNIDQGKICLAMNHLYQTGLIDSTEDTFVIKEDMKELLNGMKEAEYAVFVRSGCREEQAICCFSVPQNSFETVCDRKNPLKKFVAVQLSETDTDSYKIYSMDEAELTEKIRDEFLQGCKNRISQGNIRKYHNFILSAEQVEMKNGRTTRKALVRLTPEGVSLEIMDKGRTVTECKGCKETDVLEAVRYVCSYP